MWIDNSFIYMTNVNVSTFQSTRHVKSASHLSFMSTVWQVSFVSFHLVTARPFFGGNGSIVLQSGDEKFIQLHSGVGFRCINCAQIWKQDSFIPEGWKLHSSILKASWNHISRKTMLHPPVNFLPTYNWPKHIDCVFRSVEKWM